MLSLQNIFDTIDMIDKQHLDIRTITMGISLLDCVSEDADRCCRKIYDKICRRAEKLVRTGEDIESEFGIPIVNKRISVTPMALVAGSCDTEDYVPFAMTLDRAAHTCGVNFIGGYSALVQKGFSKGDELLLRSIPQALAQTELVCSSVNVGSTKAGINMDAVARMGRIIKETAHLTRAQDGLGCAKLVVFCNAVEDNPFMAGAFHGVGEADSVINVGVSGPGVVYHALQSCKGQPFDVVAETIKKTAFQITRMGQMVAAEASRRLDTPFGIVDLSLAPTPAVGDSVARILEEMGLAVCGTHGTTAALALLNDAVKKGGVMASGHVGGLSGAFIPVSEDEGMIAAALDGTLTIDKLEAMTCVCSVGLDMIAVPGSTSAETIAAIIADEAAVGMVNSKTTAVRVIPVEGADVGDMVEMGGLLGSAPVMPVHEASSADFIARGGRIPAPLQSLKTDGTGGERAGSAPHPDHLQRGAAVYAGARQHRPVGERLPVGGAAAAGSGGGTAVRAGGRRRRVCRICLHPGRGPDLPAHPGRMAGRQSLRHHPPVGQRRQPSWCVRGDGGLGGHAVRSPASGHTCGQRYHAAVHGAGGLCAVRRHPCGGRYAAAGL